MQGGPIKGNIHSGSDCHNILVKATQGDLTYQNLLVALLITQRMVNLFQWNFKPATGPHQDKSCLWLLLLQAQQNKPWAVQILQALLNQEKLPALEWNTISLQGQTAGISPFWFLVEAASGNNSWAIQGLDKLCVDNLNQFNWNVAPVSGPGSGRTPVLIVMNKVTQFSWAKNLTHQLLATVPLTHFNWSAKTMFNQKPVLVSELLQQYCQSNPTQPFNYDLEKKFRSAFEKALTGARTFYHGIEARLPIDVKLIIANLLIQDAAKVELASLPQKITNAIAHAYLNKRKAHLQTPPLTHPVIALEPKNPNSLSP